MAAPSAAKRAEEVPLAVVAVAHNAEVVPVAVVAVAQNAEEVPVAVPVDVAECKKRVVQEFERRLLRLGATPEQLDSPHNPFPPPSRYMYFFDQSAVLEQHERHTLFEHLRRLRALLGINYYGL
jgi:hypothetical protein